MKAIQIHEPGDVSKLSISDLLISDPNANEVRVRVSYAGVNFMDIGTRQGQLRMPTGGVLCHPEESCNINLQM